MIIIIAPEPLLRERIASVLQNTPYKVVVCSSRPATELPHVSSAKGEQTFAIIGVDERTGNLDEAADNVRLLRSFLPDGKVVMVVETNGPIRLQGILDLSPDACIFNLDSRDTLIRVLELTSMDRRVFVLPESTAATAVDDHQVSVHAKLLSSSGSYRLGTIGENLLSPRERQILTCLAEGKTNKAIARLHGLSEATVKVHLKAILRKTKAQNRTQAAIWAIEDQLRSQKY